MAFRHSELKGDMEGRTVFNIFLNTGLASTMLRDDVLIRENKHEYSLLYHGGHEDI